jgi:hypothetical protein
MLGLAKNPLDAHYVSFTCTLTAGLSGKTVLKEDFGGCTDPPGKEAVKWGWIGYGQESTQYMASKEAPAEYYTGVFPKLIEVGAIGALSWCFSDYFLSFGIDLYVLNRGMNDTLVLYAQMGA